MTLPQPALDQLTAAYVLGTLTPRVRRRFEARLRRDPALRHLWLRWEQRLSGLAEDLPGVRATEENWEQIATRLRAPAGGVRRGGSRGWLGWVGLVIAVALALLWLSARQ
jgi:anti-sigma-K factor RskA